VRRALAFRVDDLQPEALLEGIEIPTAMEHE
jgi:hypothetical protein